MTNYPYDKINIIAVPTSFCNMNCQYCHNSVRKYDRTVMSEDVLKKMFEITIPYFHEIHFIWHGGEPLSVGLDFYKKALAVQQALNINNTIIKNSIQSNLTLITDEIAEFLCENNFAVGGSYDGCANEVTRQNSDRILKGHRILEKHGVKSGFICVIQNNNVNRLIQDYQWFNENNISYALNPYLCNDPGNDPLAPPADLVSKNLCELFDYSYSDPDRRIGIRLFDNIISFLKTGNSHSCSYNPCLGRYFGIRPDGSIHPDNRDFPQADTLNSSKTNSGCDCFGNVMDYSDIRECTKSPEFLNLAGYAVKRREYCKENCDIYHFCHGGCNHVASLTGCMEKPNSYYCKITRTVYLHIAEKIKI